MNHQIYQEVRDRILYLTYEPGRILNEQTLAREFGVSRTPLREVLNRLEWEHLVRILPRTGTLVTEIELNKVVDVFRIRMEIEELVGRLATEKWGPPQLSRLEELRQECRALYDNRNRKALAGIDVQLKGLFHETAGNPYLTEISDRLYALTFRLWYLNMDRGEWNHEVEAVEAELTELLTVLPGQDPLKVGQSRKACLMKHLERIRNKFLGLTA